MGGIAKKVVVVTVGLLVVFALLVAVIPQIQTNLTGFTTVTEEIVATGNGVLTVFDFTLERQPVEISGDDFQIYDDTETFTDDGDGTLTGDGGGSGTIVYTTGVVQVTFNAAVTNEESIFADYNVEDVPDILTTLANLWWVPLIIVLVALIMGTSYGRRLSRRLISRCGRRRRRR